jgi:hypothetical protein
MADILKNAKGDATIGNNATGKKDIMPHGFKHNVTGMAGITDTLGMTVAGQMQRSFFMGAGIVLALVIGFEMWKHKAITKIFSK